MAYQKKKKKGKLLCFLQKEFFNFKKSFLTIQYGSHKTQLLFKITVSGKTEVFVFIDLEVESKKGKCRDSRGFSLEGKKGLDHERGICFP